MAPFSSTLGQQGWLLGPELCQGEIVGGQFPGTKENHTLSQLDLVHTDISKEAKQPQNYVNGMNYKCIKVPKFTMAKICFY